jgi:2-C-methyl-D-erythritol 4-phosphate cytidylyltransferase
MNASSASIWAVVPAAGRGQRMGGELPKQYLEIAGRTLLEHSLGAVLAHPSVVGAVVALAADDTNWPEIEARLGAASCDKPVLRCRGGDERADSVRAALEVVLTQSADAWALVHDAARPCLRLADLDRLIARCLEDGQGGLLAAPVRDTLKRVDPEVPAPNQSSLGTEPRQGLWRALTPQLFPARALAEALDAATAAGLRVTDEAMAMENAGTRPLLIEGADDNLKVTTPADLALAEFVLSSRESGIATRES